MYGYIHFKNIQNNIIHYKLYNKSIRERIPTKFMMVVASRIEGKGYGTEKGNNGNFTRNALFLLLIKKSSETNISKC